MKRDLTTIYVLRTDLQQASKDYYSVLRELKSLKLISTFEAAFAVTMDSNQAAHFQTVLEGFFEQPITISRKRYNKEIKNGITFSEED